MGLREALDKVLARTDLSKDEAAGALQEIVSGDVRSLRDRLLPDCFTDER